MPAEASYWAVVPAAGVGRRMGDETPKQYLSLLGRPVIAHTLERLCNHRRISGVVVALAREDHWWGDVRTDAAQPPITAPGGSERCHSVLNGLEALAERAAGNDWVLVHDAVRPCLRLEDLDRLMETLEQDPVGGLLATRVKDTMKRATGDGQVSGTVSRESLWHALTPQMFRFDALRSALRLAIDEGRNVTDEAQAMELSGLRPRVVEGHDDNIKITRREDMALAEFFLTHQERAP